MENSEQDFKTIKIKKNIWKELNVLKLNEDAKTISDVIRKIIDYYKKNKE